MVNFLRYIVSIFVLSAFLSNQADGADMGNILAAADTSISSSNRSAQVAPPQQNPPSRSIFSLLRRNISPARTAPVISVEGDKLVNSVKIFPNPVSDNINLSFRLSRQSTVSIKVMDALGNEVMTLLNQQLEAGEQNHAFDTQNKLTTGFYFIRVLAGNETVVKRISVL